MPTMPQPQKHAQATLQTLAALVVKDRVHLGGVRLAWAAEGSA